MTRILRVARPKIAISIDAGVLRRLDALVRTGAFESRSQAIEALLRTALEREQRTRLARECARLDPEAERRLADEGLDAEQDAWPAY